MGGDGSSANSLALRHTELFSVAFYFCVLRAGLLQNSRKNNGGCRCLLAFPLQTLAFSLLLCKSPNSVVPSIYALCFC